MKQNELIGRIAQKAEIPDAEAFEALAATLQGLIDNLCGTVFTTISIAPDPAKPLRMFVDVPNPPTAHSDVPNPSTPRVDVPDPPPTPRVDVPDPPPTPRVDVPDPPPTPRVERNPSGLVAYVAGRVGISSTAASVAMGVILDQISVVGREAGIKTRH